MLDVQKTINNLIGMDASDQDEIIAAVETENDVIVSSVNEMNAYNAQDGLHLLYEDAEDSTQIKFKVENGTITDAWEV